MHLQELKLYNFKNFSQEYFKFDHKINCFVGNNGVGKTNILDAIYFLALGKSYFNNNIRQIIKFNEQAFSINGLFKIDNEAEAIHISYQLDKKKTIKRNNKVYSRLADHIGLIPLVMISPYDRDLISESGETRRKFIDKIISQADVQYLNTLINYQKVLMQRNRLLKYFAANHKFDRETLSIYNQQLHEYGQIIYQKRTDFINEFAIYLKEKYQILSQGKEVINITYDTALQKKNLIDLLNENIQKDRILQHTSQGIHRDDFLFEIHDKPIKKFGSQGQQKSYLIALRLAEFEFLKQKSEQIPILLFDDVFDKLDESRVEQIVKMVNDETFGQIFISDTHAQRTENLVKKTHQSFKIFNL
ncbi:MAG TPA: DNA replication and repair protein RecF [Flavobacteriales bacterium]|nr:DNA replication and repair protein RecF [Flavobacteriales bacterium]